MAGIFSPAGLSLGILSQPTLPGTRMLQAATKRKAFFSFHYDDIMRVNNVRNAWKINHPDNALMRSFYDLSLWESKKLEGDDAVKRLVREGVEYSSVVCVLSGTYTWSRRWCRYEIARSVIDARGLLAVHINSINHHQWPYQPHPLGWNPLEFVGIGTMADGTYRLFEKKWFQAPGALNLAAGEWCWIPYEDYTRPIPLPRFLAPADIGYVRSLSAGARIYNWMADIGHTNLGSWIDAAAKAAGR